MREIFTEFASHDGALTSLGLALGSRAIDQPQGKFLREQWQATGVVDGGFSKQLDALAGMAPDAFEFSEALVSELAKLGETGDRTRGEKLFGGSRAGCAACHRTGETGGASAPT